MANIYEISNQFSFLKTLEETGELDEEAVKGALDVAKEDLADKLEDYCKVIKNFESLVSGLKDEEARLKARRTVYENTIDRMKEAMKYAVDMAGEKKIPCGTFTVSVQNNPPKCVLDLGVADIPSKYLISQLPTVDKKLLLDDLKASGKEVPYAHLEQTTSLRIR